MLDRASAAGVDDDVARVRPDQLAGRAPRRVRHVEPEAGRGLGPGLGPGLSRGLSPGLSPGAEARASRKRGRDQRRGVVRRCVDRAGARRRRSRSGPPPAMAKPTRRARSAERDQGVAAQVALEVDGEVVAAAAPAPRRRRPAGRCRPRPNRAPATARRASRRDRCRAAARRSERFQLPTTRSIVAPGRVRPHRLDGRRRHQQIADPLEPQQQDPPRRRRRGPARPQPGDAGAERQHAIGGGDEPPFPRVVDLQIGHGYLTSTRSTMTPRSRSSGTPRTAFGCHTLVTSLRRTGVPDVPAAAASAGGIGSV